MTKSPNSVRSFKIESTPLGVNSQTCHKALTVTILAKQSERVPITVPRRTTYGKITRKKQNEIIAQVGRQILKG